MAVVVLTLFLLAIIVIIVISRGRGPVPDAEDSSPERLPYEQGEALFTPAERSFLGVLDQVAGTQYRVFGKVRLADVVAVVGARDAGERQVARNRIDRKHFDFVLCDPASFTVLCAIELDDSSHRRAARQDRDAFVDEVCRAARLPLVRVPAQRAYSIAELRLLIEKAVARPSIEVIDNV